MDSMGRPTRRELLRSSMFASVGFLFSSALGGAGAFMWPTKLGGFGGPVGVPKKLSEIKVGDVIKVREGKFYLTRTEDGLMALYWKCVHLGCTVPYTPGDQHFLCPCHSSKYQLTGQNIAGPAPRPLDYMELRVDGESITVDTGRIHSRSVHAPEHAVQP